MKGYFNQSGDCFRSPEDYVRFLKAFDEEFGGVRKDYDRMVAEVRSNPSKFGLLESNSIS